MPPSSSDSPIGLLRGGAVQSGESKYFLRRRSQGQGDGKAGKSIDHSSVLGVQVAFPFVLMRIPDAIGK